MLPPDEEILQSDVYLETLLEAHRRAPRGLPSEIGTLDPDLRRAAHALDRALVRFHPSFRFEQALADRLHAAAETMLGGERPRGASVPVPFPSRVPSSAGFTPEEARETVQRILVGGAIASGVSLAGAAAWVAWRRRSRTETVA